MKRVLLAFLFLGLAPQVHAGKLCTLTSEVDKDVVIEIEGFRSVLMKVALLTYKDKPKYRMSFHHKEGYGGHFYSISPYRSDIDPGIPWQKYMHPENRGGGIVSLFVGNQVAKATPVEERKEGQRRALMPSLGQTIYYSKDYDSRIEPENIKVVHAAEGFWRIEGKKCGLPYVW